MTYVLFSLQTGSLEGQHFRKTKQLVSLSEQQLVDCSSSYGNYDCYGGFQRYAYNYIQAVGGIEGEQDYPYSATQGYCRFNKNYVRATVTGWSWASRGNENDLQQAVASVGPISVAIDASKRSFQFYRGGVYYEPSCSSNSQDLDHAVLAVGYGSDGGSDNWLVKNSWGIGWGEWGYIRMARNRNNNCGIATMTLFPNVFPAVSKSLGLNIVYNPSVGLASLILCYVNVRSYIG